ncbi:MAG: diguanylate cyclase [Candidatus Schekmanbacteria bacterium]|nr:diguanylate cyclase [Candidatus Schekmanbacteria bacterium]
MHVDKTLSVGYLTIRLVQSMVTDTLLAILIATVYFHLVVDLDLTKGAFFVRGLVRIAPPVMILYGAVLFALHGRVVRFLSMLAARRRRGEVAIPEDEESLRHLRAARGRCLWAPALFASVGLAGWLIGTALLAAWMRTRADLPTDETLLLVWGGLLCGLATNSYSYFRVRRISRVVLTALQQASPRAARDEPLAGASLQRRFLMTVAPLMVFAVLMGSMATAARVVRDHQSAGATQVPQAGAAAESPARSFLASKTGVSSAMLTGLSSLGPVIGLSLFLTLMLAIAAARDIAEPVRGLLDEADAVAAGRLDTVIFPASGDEIGQLARSVEVMRRHLVELLERETVRNKHLVAINAELTATIDNLKQLRDAGRQLSSTLDAGEIHRLALDVFIGHLPIGRAVLLLYNAETSMLESVLAHGFESSEWTDFGLRIDNSIRRYLLELDYLLVDDGIDLGLVEPRTRESLERIFSKYRPSLLLPLRIERELVGLVALGPLGALGTPEPYTDGQVKFCATLASQSAMAIHNARLYQLATTDALTELYVRRYFEQRLKEEVSRGRRYGQPVTVLVLDIDFFKQINDEHGHPRGDRVLEDVGSILRASCRAMDIAARLGGEEFAIVLPQTTLAGGIVIAERLRKTVEEHSFLGLGADDPVLAVTVSIGVAVIDPEGDESNARLMARADEALYLAKKSGRNRVCASRLGAPPE